MPVAADVAAARVAAAKAAVVASTVLIVLGEAVGGRTHCTSPPRAIAAQQDPVAVYVAAAKPDKAAVGAPTAAAAAAALCRHVWLRQQVTGVVLATKEVVRQQVRRGCHAPPPRPFPVLRPLKCGRSGDRTTAELRREVPGEGGLEPTASAARGTRLATARGSSPLLSPPFRSLPSRPVATR